MSLQPKIGSPRFNGGTSPRFSGGTSPKLLVSKNSSSSNSANTIVKPLDLGPLEPFLKPDFDVTQYTKEASTGIEKSEASLNSLKGYLETVERAISTHVVAHEDSLLGTLEAVGSLKREMIRGKADSFSLLSSLTRVENDFNDPLERLKTTGRSLRNAHDATGVLRKLGWFLVARKKLKLAIEESKQQSSTTINIGKEAAKAAQLVAELEELMSDGSLKGVKIVDEEGKWIREMGVKVRQDAQRALEAAVISLNQADMGLALQAFFHLNILEDRISAITFWAAKEFSQEAREALKEVNSSNSSSNTNDSITKYQNIRTRMDTMLERSLRSWALRVWNLQRVLSKRRDPTSHLLFSEVVKIDVFDSFWNRSTAALEQELKSRWVREALVDDYARLRRSARSMLGRLYASTSSVAAGSNGKKSAVGGVKETQALMQAFHPLLHDFLSRISSRLTQPVNMMFPEEERGLRHIDPRPKSIPTSHDVTTFAQIIGKELLAVKDDQELLGAVAKACGVAVSLFCVKSEAIVSKVEAAHHFKLLPPELSFSVSSASAVPISSTSRNSVQDHNVGVLIIASLLSQKLKEIVDSISLVIMQNDANNNPMNGEDGTNNNNLDDSTNLGGDEDGEIDNNNVTIINDEDDDQNDETSMINSSPSKNPQTTSDIPTLGSKLEAARRQLEQLIGDILQEYIGSDACFRALDDYLQDVNAENYNSSTESITPRNFTVKFARACKSLKEEHLSKLPHHDPICQEYIRQLVLKVMNRFSLRVALVRPLNPVQGRQSLLRDASSVFESALTLLSAGTDDLEIRNRMSGLELLIGGNSSTQNGKISKSLVWHHLFATAPSDVHSPHTRANKPLVQYLKLVENLPDDQVWPYIVACLNGKDESIRKPFLQV